MSLAMSQREFGMIFAKLAMQLRWHDADQAVVLSYYDVLGELEIGPVSMAAERFAREPGRKFPPTAPEWFASANELRSETDRKRLAGAVRDPWKHECLSCEDSGWELALECDGGGEQWPEEIPKGARGVQTAPGNRRPVGFRAVERASVKPRASICGKRESHYPHAFTKPCGCRATNRTYQRHSAIGGGTV
jgi:hypothetical protein